MNSLTKSWQSAENSFLWQFFLLQCFLPIKINQEFILPAIPTTSNLESVFSWNLLNNLFYLYFVYTSKRYFCQLLSLETAQWPDKAFFDLFFLFVCFFVFLQRSANTTWKSQENYSNPLKNSFLLASFFSARAALSST